MGFILAVIKSPLIGGLPRINVTRTVKLFTSLYRLAVVVHPAVEVCLEVQVSGN